MTNMKLFSGILFGVLLLFAGISLASAADLSIGAVWSDSTTSMTITNGSTAYFNYYFSTATTPMHISIIMYNYSGTIPIHTFLEGSPANSYFYNTAPVPVTPQIYKNPGSYRITFTASNIHGTYTNTIYLTVLPSTNPINHAPVITSTPVIQVNESSVYNYQVTAYDPDGDPLSYSLEMFNNPGPMWLFINPSTGLILGTAPAVNSDTNYTFQVQVTDGVNLAFQNFNVTVKNNSTIPVNPDTMPPVINLNSPENNYLTNSSTLNFSAFVSDNVNVSGVFFYLNGILNQTNISGLNDANYTFSLNNLADGVYLWSYGACDNSSNCALSATRNLTLDTTPPSVAFVNNTPDGNSILNSTEIPINITASDSLSGLKNVTVYLYNSSGEVVRQASDNIPEFSFTMISLPAGDYYLNATAWDIAGNSKSTNTREITLNNSFNNQTNQTGGNNPSYNVSNYHYVDVYANQYQEQLNRTNTGIVLTSPETTKANLTWLWVVIVVLLVLMIIATIFILMNIGLNKEEKKR